MEEDDNKRAFDFLQIDSHSLSSRDDQEQFSIWIKTQATCVFLLAMCNDMSHCKRKDGNEDLSKLLIQNVELRRRIIIMKKAEERIMDSYMTSGKKRQLGNTNVPNIELGYLDVLVNINSCQT